jgi:hypothetical protein
MRRRAFHRTVFLMAAAYNIAWGICTALDPDWLFRWCGMAPSNRPEIFACLGMVIAVCGLLYVEVARAPETGGAIVLVCLLGKVFGPLGWLGLVLAGSWPVRSGVLCVFNDAIWWVPFGLYLADRRSVSTAAA